MNIGVVAANGRTGKEFVKYALKNSHVVHAGVFGNHNLQKTNSLKIYKCDATNYQDVKVLTENCNVVVSFIGHTKNSPKDVQAQATKNIIKASKENKIKRVISLTGTGVRLPGDKITLVDKFLNFSIKLIDPDRINDGINHVELIKNSDLDWTIIRVLKLTNSEPKKFSLKENGPAKIFVSRKEVAQAALEIIEKNEFIKKAPIISV